MHGTIKLESSTGNGTTASFRIPFNKPRHDGASPLVEIGSLPDRLQSEMSVSCTSSDLGYNAGSPIRVGTPNQFGADGMKMPIDLPMSERNKIEVLVVEDVCFISIFLKFDLNDTHRSEENAANTIIRYWMTRLLIPRTGPNHQRVLRITLNSLDDQKIFWIIKLPDCGFLWLPKSFQIIRRLFDNHKLPRPPKRSPFCNE